MEVQANVKEVVTLYLLLHANQLAFPHRKTTPKEMPSTVFLVVSTPALKPWARSSSCTLVQELWGNVSLRQPLFSIPNLTYLQVMSILVSANSYLEFGHYTIWCYRQIRSIRNFSFFATATFLVTYFVTRHGASSIFKLHRVTHVDSCDLSVPKKRDVWWSMIKMFTMVIK